MIPAKTARNLKAVSIGRRMRNPCQIALVAESREIIRVIAKTIVDLTGAQPNSLRATGLLVGRPLISLSDGCIFCFCPGRRWSVDKFC
jgi:hypothetical protein